MKNNTVKQPETPKAHKSEKYTDKQKETLTEISQQLEMAFKSDKTPQGVKDCLYTIIFEASNEAGLPLGDMSLVRTAFPNIIEALPKDYGTVIYHSIHAILQHDTTAFREFCEQRLDKGSEPKPKTQDEVISESDRERQPYLDLLKSLDDEDTARSFGSLATDFLLNISGNFLKLFSIKHLLCS